MRVLFRTIILALALIPSSIYAQNLYIFTAGWCAPCKKLKTMLYNDIDIPKWYDVSMIDIDEFPELAKKYSVKVLPTTLLLDEGKEISRITGYSSSYKNQLKNLRKTNDKSSKPNRRSSFMAN
jgi:thiol-disulfide isomerase/thioredoxin